MSVSTIANEYLFVNFFLVSVLCDSHSLSRTRLSLTSMTLSHLLSCVLWRDCKWVGIRGDFCNAHTDVAVVREKCIVMVVRERCIMMAGRERCITS